MSMRYPGGLIATSPVNARYPSGVWTQAQAAPYQAQNVWTRDQFWPYTTLLLQGDGAVNGAQNNTFLDSSSNNFTITRNGNTTQGAFTPYEQDGYWSNYFDGSTNSFISAPNNTALDLSGVAFTIEGWIFPTRTFNGAQSGFRNIISKRTPSGGATNYNIQLWFNSNKIGFWNGSSVALSSAEVPLNAWTHFAYTYNGSNTLTLWLNGAVDTVFTYTVGANTSDPVRIGSHIDDTGTYNNFGGYISNIRVVKGSQVYSGSTFVPPAAPLTAITNTSLLTCQSNRFKDNSTNAFAITVNGSPSVQAFQPFPGATTWSASVLGGSGYFDGSGDTLSVASNAAFGFGTGDFTVELFVYCSFNGAVQEFIDARATGTAVPWVFGITGTGVARTYDGSTVRTGGQLFANAWNHVAWVRASNVNTVYVNGVSGHTWTASQDFGSSKPILVGDNIGGGEPFAGYISNLRIVKGTAVYTGAFTPPTAPLTAITNTSLLCSFTNAGIYDNSMMNNLETVGNAQVSTSVVKYGTGSMAFDATDDRLVAPASPNIALGTGDFTIEFWMSSNDVSGATQRGIFQTSDTAGGLKTTYTTGVMAYQGVNATLASMNGGLAINVAGTFLSSNTVVLTTGAWYHIAIVRLSGTVTVYVNGAVHVTGSASGNCSGQFICVGGTYNTSYLYNGYLDDFRITKGAARYITNFTPPIARLPAQ